MLMRQSFARKVLHSPSVARKDMWNEATAIQKLRTKVPPINIIASDTGGWN